MMRYDWGNLGHVEMPVRGAFFGAAMFRRAWRRRLSRFRLRRRRRRRLFHHGSRRLNLFGFGRLLLRLFLVLLAFACVLLLSDGYSGNQGEYAKNERRRFHYFSVRLEWCFSGACIVTSVLARIQMNQKALHFEAP